MSTPLVPIAISSEIDHAGDERIHAAVYTRANRAVFRITPWTPSVLNLGLWLKADAPANKLTIDENSKVAVWADDSGFGRDVTLAETSPPAGRGPEVSIYNRHRTVINSIATGYGMRSVDAGLRAMFNGMDDFWVFVVSRPDPTYRYSGRMISWESPNFGGDFRIHPSLDETPKEQYYVYAGFRQYNYGQEYTFGEGLHIFGNEFYALDAATDSLRCMIDGSNIPNISGEFYNASWDETGFADGHTVMGSKTPREDWLTNCDEFLIMGLYGQHWVGQMCEVVAGNTPLTTEERQKLEGYLAWKWTGPDSDLVALLPIDHPYKLAAPIA